MSFVNKPLFQLLARVLIAALFLPAGIDKLHDFAGITGYIASVGLPMPALAAALAAALEIGGSLALLLGWCTPVAALLLALFTLLTSVLFHPFWAVPAAELMMTQMLFFKNVAVMGGLLSLAASGAGAWSLDARRAG